MLESICYKSSTQEEAIAMDYPNHITNHEKGKQAEHNSKLTMPGFVTYNKKRAPKLRADA